MGLTGVFGNDHHRFVILSILFHLLVVGIRFIMRMN